MKVFTEVEAEKLIGKYLPVSKSKLVRSVDEAVKAAKIIKYPVALKIISKQALHKSDIGGVLFIKNEKELVNGFNKLEKISKRCALKLEGILVQEFFKGKQIIIGIKKDPSFGHAIMFGLGGVLVEVFKDVSFRICPITDKDAQEMIDELKSKQILYGFRGDKGVDIKLLKKILVKSSKIPLKHKDITELDINPLIITDKIAKVVDARIVF